MKKIYLQNTTDFVFDIDKYVSKDIWQFHDSWILQKLNTIERYAKFLKQPIELWMFVPCDEDGNVLEEPMYEPSNE